jgi:hypothetical protein
MIPENRSFVIYRLRSSHLQKQVAWPPTSQGGSVLIAPRTRDHRKGSEDISD